MSVALLPDVSKHRKANSRIWLRDIDTSGRCVDPRFIEAGYRKEEEFFRYRSDKLSDEAVVANLIEEAVYRASRAGRKEPLRDVGAYLFRVFSNLADREIARAAPTTIVEPEVLANSPHMRAEGSKELFDRIQVREILDQVPVDIRWALQRRSVGFEVQEIAQQLNVSADCLSTRIRRAVRALQRLVRDDVE